MPKQSGRHRIGNIRYNQDYMDLSRPNRCSVHRFISIIIHYCSVSHSSRVPIPSHETARMVTKSIEWYRRLTIKCSVSLFCLFATNCTQYCRMQLSCWCMQWSEKRKFNLVQPIISNCYVQTPCLAWLHTWRWPSHVCQSLFGLKNFVTLSRRVLTRQIR